MVLYCESLPPEKEYFSPIEQGFGEVEVTKHILYTFIHSDSPCSISHEWHCSVYMSNWLFHLPKWWRWWVWSPRLEHQTGEVWYLNIMYWFNLPALLLGYRASRLCECCCWLYFHTFLVYTIHMCWLWRCTGWAAWVCVCVCVHF